MSRSDEIQPPQPPPFQRRIQIGWLQVLGVSALALLPLADLVGALGVREQQARAASGPLRLEVRYPDPAHYNGAETLEVRVTNSGPAPVGRMAVRIDSGYLQGFAAPRSTTPPRSITAEHYEFELAPLSPGQTQRLLVALEPKRIGRHDGRVTAAPAEGGESVAVGVSTRVLP